MNSAELLAQTTNKLSEAKINSAIFEAKIILEEVAGMSGWQLDEVSEQQVRKVWQIINRRIKGEPLQYIIGSWEFWGLNFEIGPGVLIPRPETELLVELSLQNLKEQNNPIVVDLCSGSGCVGIAIAKEWPDAKVFLIEKSNEAFSFLARNLKRHATNNTIPILADIFDYEFEGLADIITANPPYIKTHEIETLQREVKFEPRLALDGGDEGLDFYGKIARIWGKRLKPDGKMFLEFGIGQAMAVAQGLKEWGLETRMAKDLEGRERVAIGYRA